MFRAFCDHRNQVIVPTEQGWEDGYGTKGNSSYAGRFDTAGCAAEAGIPTVCKVGHTDTQSVDTDGESISDRRNHLLYRTGNSELYRKCAGDGSADFRKLVLSASGIFIRSTHSVSYLPQDCKMGRRRCIGTDHRICQFRDGTCGGIPKGRSGIRHRLQDIYYCRAGDIVWDFFQLGVGVDMLGVADVWNPCGVVPKSRIDSDGNEHSG